MGIHRHTENHDTLIAHKRLLNLQSNNARPYAERNAFKLDDYHNYGISLPNVGHSSLSTIDANRDRDFEQEYNFKNQYEDDSLSRLHDHPLMQTLQNYQSTK